MSELKLDEADNIVAKYGSKQSLTPEQERLLKLAKICRLGAELRAEGKVK